MYADQIDNDIRRDIFLKLCKAEALRYADLKPKEMESNHFAYHLKKLKDDGFIEQREDDGLYTLAPKGLRLADMLSFKTDLIRTQPKTVILLVAKSIDGKKILAGTRQRQPHFGLKVLPAGKLHFGETVKEAADRTLAELLPKADNTRLKKSGTATVMYRKNGICISHIFAHLYNIQLTEAAQEELAEQLDNSSVSTFWEDIDKVGSGGDWLEGAKDVLEASEDDSSDVELIFDK